MIQRIQTLYLLVIAILMGVMLFMPLARFFGGAEEFRLMAFGIEAAAAPDGTNYIAPTPWMGILITIAAAWPLVTIFFFRRRPVQIRFCLVEIVLLLGVQAYVVFYLARVHGSVAAFAVNSVKYSLPDIFPLLGTIFAWLAYRAVIRDEALVRSLDRIR